MQYLPNYLAATGDTPLIALPSLTRGLRPLLLAKAEQLNPGGSVKDRIGAALIEQGEREGKLRPGGTIVEPTSGNTGVALAIAAAAKGYKLIFTIPDKVADEKRALLRAYGAEVVICPTDVPRESEESYYRVADRLARDTPNAYQPNQYYNEANPDAHYRSTGPEIWQQTVGEITHLVASVGTGGTITGIGRYLKEQSDSVVIVGADPAGSIYTQPNNVHLTSPRASARTSIPARSMSVLWTAG
ncbi:MAG: pyridoxal-phosphate dependent enzyme [Chloroflexia bacterium]